MTEYTFIDTNVLIYLGKEQAQLGNPALDSIYTPTNQVVITGTVYDEATSNAHKYPDAAAIKAWIDRGIILGRIRLEPTQIFPAGIKNAGELSIIAAAVKYGNEPVIFVSNDDFFIKTALGPNQRLLSPQEFLLKSLFDGGISPVQYFVTSNNMMVNNGGLPSLAIGQELLGSNGVKIDARNALRIFVTDSDGETFEFNPFDKFVIDHEGHVKHIGRFIPGPFCFSAGTPIFMADNSFKPIEDIAVGDTVMAFDGFDALQPRKVVRLFGNVTEEWLELTFSPESELAPLVVTPGHAFFTKNGNFAPIESLVDARTGMAEVVLEDGSFAEVSVRRIVHSAETAHLFEAAQMTASAGALALKPRDGWRTYNFEVEGLHTYVAGGVRVHNESEPSDHIVNAVQIDTLKALFGNDLIVVPLDSTANKFAYFIDGDREMVLTDGTTVTYRDYANMAVEKQATLSEMVSDTLDNIPGYLQMFAPAIIADLIAGASLETVAKNYAIKLAIEIGADGLSKLFRLEGTQVAVDALTGKPVIDDKLFFDTQAGEALKSAIVNFAMVAAIRGADMTGSDYAKLAANVSISEAITYVIATSEWNQALLSPTIKALADNSFVWSKPPLSPQGAAAAAAAIAFASNLIDHGFKDFDKTLISTAIAATTTMIGNIIGVGLSTVLGPLGPLLGTVLGSVLGNLFGGLFGPKLPPPPFIQTEDNPDGSQTIYVTNLSGGYITSARDGQNDILIGNFGSDTLFGSAGNNQLYGNGGNDTLWGYDGDDILSGGAGIDTLIGGEGADKISGGADDDTIFGDQKVQLGPGAPAVSASGGNDVITAGSGNDYAHGGGGDDHIDGEAGDDTLEGDLGNDVLIGGDGNDSVSGGAGDDTLYGDAILLDGAGGVVMTGSGDDRLDGGDGNDTIYAGGGNDTVDGGIGNDMLNGMDGNDLLQGGDGNDSLYGGAGHDTLEGGAGDDTLSGMDGDDALRGGLGNDSINGGTGNDRLSGAEGRDTLFGGAGNDELRGGDHSDTLLGEDGHDFLDGQGGDDNLNGGAGNDRMFGGEGNDTINGDLGDDAIDGNGGDDLIFGGVGNDSIVGGAGNDRLLGEIGNDYLQGFSGNDILSGGAGNDRLDGSLGDDTLEGGDGDDRLDGGDGADRLNGGDGIDTLAGGTGNDILSGGAGDDRLNGGDGDDTVTGGLGNDVLEAGNGNDRLEGGLGDDTYEINLNGARGVIADEGGSDTVRLTAEFEPKHVILSKDGNDLLIGNRARPEMTIRIEGHFAARTAAIESLAFADGFKISLSSLIIGTDGDDNLIGTDEDDGILGLGGNDSILGQGGNDFLDGGPGDDVIYGGDGNDVIHGSGESDLLSGDAGDDTIVDGFGNDMLIGGDGADKFVVSRQAIAQDVIADFETGKDRIDFSAHGRSFVTLKQLTMFGGSLQQKADDAVVALSNGQVLTVKDVNSSALREADFVFDITARDGLTGTEGNDRITGGASDDSITDGAGLDILTGGVGRDTFVISKGADDLDTITDFELAQDRIDLTGIVDAISVAQLRLEQIGADTIIHLGAGQRLMLENVDKRSLTDDHFVFDTFKDLTGEAQRYNGAVVYDFSGDGAIEGDTLNFTPAQDNIHVPAGSGGAGSPGQGFNIHTGQHIWNVGEGNYNVFNNNEYSVAVGGKQKRWETRQDMDMRGLDVGATETVVVEEYGDDPDWTYQRPIPFNDFMYGAWWAERIWGYEGHDAIYGNDGDDQIWAGGGNDYVEGGNNDDTIYGEHGNDNLIGGPGGDWIDGGADNDIIHGQDGHDALNGGLGDDYVDGGADNDQVYGSDGSDVLLGGTGHDYMRGGGHNDSMHGGAGDDYLNGDWGDDYIEGNEGDDAMHGEDGHDVLIGGVGGDQIFGGSGNDTLLGQDSHDYLAGGLGNDRIDGGNHNDVLFGEDGDDALIGGEGYDRISGGNGDDTINGGDDWDHIEGNGGNDLIYGEAGKNWIHGGGGIDVIYGGADDDMLYGGAGSDLIEGGDGSDFIDGGTNNDVIAGGAGHDRIFGGHGNDHVSGGTGDDLIDGGDGADTLAGWEGKDSIRGGSGNDFLLGMDGNDRLSGDDGDDLLWGGTGADFLIGGAGADTLIGHNGGDVLTGGDGGDVFKYDLVADSSINAFDVIADFNRAEDRIDLTALKVQFQDITIQVVDGYTDIGIANTEFSLRLLGDHHGLDQNSIAV